MPAPPHAYLSPRLSPDGARLAVSTIDGEQDLWVWEFARATLTRLTFTPVAEYIGLWTPDGDRIVYDSGILGTTDLYWRAADGSGAAERLTDSPDIATFAQTLSPDGTKLVYWERLMNEGAELHLLSLDDGRRSEPLIVTEFSNVNAEISPDGRWLAYQSDSSGQWEIYVQPFPNVDDGKWQISTTGGVQPAWGPDGRELFYRSNSDLMGVVVETDPGFALGTPVPIIADRYFVGVSRSYDIAPDGQRFLMIKEGGASAEDADGPFAGLTRIHVVSNWFEELKARVPAER